MKNKYQRLSKSEKKECRIMYYNTIKGKEMRIRLTRLMFIGILGILFGIYMIGNGIITHQIHWYDYCVAIPLLLASITFLISSFFLKKKVLNQFAIKIPRFKNK